MNKFEPKQSQPQLDADQGWVVQVYDSKRRLLCVLESSHGWVFGLGCGVGLLLATIWVNVARYIPPMEADPPTKPPALQVD